MRKKVLPMGDNSMSVGNNVVRGEITIKEME
jgi:hypothetical protein